MTGVEAAWTIAGIYVGIWVAVAALAVAFIGAGLLNLHDRRKAAMRHGHTQRDFDTLTYAGIDPASTQPRERPTRCHCGVSTWHQAGACDNHYLAPAATLRPVVEGAAA